MTISDVAVKKVKEMVPNGEIQVKLVDYNNETGEWEVTLAAFVEVKYYKIRIERPGEPKIKGVEKIEIQ